MSWVYRLAQAAGRVVLPLQVRLRVTGVEHVPAVGPALLVSNHLSLIDPLVIAAWLRRELRILAKAELFGWPVLGGLARACGAVPIHRGEWDLVALDTLQRAVYDGQCVLVFPEGTYALPPHPPAMLPFKTGAAWLAAQTGVPVVPVAVWGSERVWAPRRGWRPWHHPRVYVRFGAPYQPRRPADLTSHEALQPVADDMARHVRALLPPRYHGVYGGGAA